MGAKGSRVSSVRYNLDEGVGSNEVDNATRNVFRSAGSPLHENVNTNSDIYLHNISSMGLSGGVVPFSTPSNQVGVLGAGDRETAGRRRSPVSSRPGSHVPGDDPNLRAPFSDEPLYASPGPERLLSGLTHRVGGGAPAS